MAEDGHYPEYWEADVVLRDGGTGHLRPISPGDAELVQAFHMRQSQNSIYLRFFTYKSRLSARELTRFTEVDHRNRVAFVVTRGTDIIGIGRYDRLDNPREAEVAFNVSDTYQGRGVGSILLEHLAAAARENGIHRFSAEVLPENRRMITVFAEAGYEVTRHFDDGVVMLEFDIDPTRRSQAVMESREHRAEARSVAELMAPSSVAVVGASREPGSVGYTFLEHVIEGGFTGTVHAVNPEAFELHGIASYASMAEVPEPVDLAVIAVPYEQVRGVVQDCARAGVRGVLVATAGYADDAAHGLARQREIVQLARSHGMRVVGPASLGIVNTAPGVRLNASMAPTMPATGSLALFSQSAGLGIMLHAVASRRGLGVSSVLSAGNRADVSGNDAMQYWEDDEATSAVGLYLESIGNPRKFSRIARRLAKTKPVIVAKSDVTGLQLPPGHAVRTTQAPAGALDAMLRQSGVIRVETTEELMDVAQIVASQPLPAGGKVAVVSNSSALGKVVADAAAAQSMTVTRLDPDLHLDAGESAGVPALEAAVKAALADDAVHAVVVTTLPVPGIGAAEIAACLQACAEPSGKPIVAVFTGIPESAQQLYGLVDSGLGGPVAAAGNLQRGIPCFASPGAALAALGAVIGYTRWRARDHGSFEDPPGVDSDAATGQLRGILGKVTGVGLRKLDPAETTTLLAHYGITLIPSVAFDTAEEAVGAAGELGWPVALKTMDEHLRHRLDLGGVRLNIDDAASLRRNIEQMDKLLAPFGSFGMEVQAMAPAGQACTIRAIEDPLLGPVLSFGMVGDAVNLLGDWGHSIPPLTTGDVVELVRSPRAARKLFGYAGLPPADVPALEQLIARVALMKDRHPEIALLELNPVLVATRGLSTLSSEIHIGNPRQRTDSARRAMRD